MANILVFSEQRSGKIKRVALEALGAAKRLIASEEDRVIAVLIGENVASLAKPLASGGADKVVLVDDPALALLFLRSLWQHCF